MLRLPPAAPAPPAAFLPALQVWGEDMILDSVELIDHAQAVAITYVECFTLRRKALDAILEEHAYPRQIVQRAARRITLQRALLKYLTQLNGKDGPVRGAAARAHGRTAARMARDA